MFKPKNKDELLNIINEIINNQEKYINYQYGLKDIDTSLINDMSELFLCSDYYRHDKINQKIKWQDPKNNITDWDTSRVTNMFDMFYKSSFNQPIGNWDVSNVTNMEGMFNGSRFNQDLSVWNVSKVTNMKWMFANSSFNQYIGNWNVSNVQNMYRMFYKNYCFNKNLYLWKNKLSKYGSMWDFNKEGAHRWKYGSINTINDFIEKQNFCPEAWYYKYKNSSDKDKFELLKFLKNQDSSFIDELKSLTKNIEINL